ncbi:hypothetical protein CXG81DRAFT_25155 [Caulochytrium protostelioides]|uniref:NADH dehydrogenase [ubiquinone] 1 beta subcomplex subunit 11, mitochondrial n=1 Tax=Caulochytrium protostelioides TaxID=1555241 RepID=A0A4P9XA22_9FUNG|nr:hypothetical protein CXG81DRAFT_25155 [Caulochytrium protostelioides]|eukprot:RKP02217.1 hypothetical protein CXG81DRAFT_25155 [Caulochytrium protostelioides]
MASRVLLTSLRSSRPTLAAPRGMPALRGLQTSVRPAGGAVAHHDHDPLHHQLEEPSGYLFGRTREDAKRWHWWEPMWYFGFCGGLVAVFTIQYWNPKDNVMVEATKEAHRRLAERGEKFGWPLPADYSPYSAINQRLAGHPETK